MLVDEFQREKTPEYGNIDRCYIVKVRIKNFILVVKSVLVTDANIFSICIKLKKRNTKHIEYNCMPTLRKEMLDSGF